ncbi:MAG: TonB-dependent receptor [Pseudomonadota bacterium]
MPTNVWAQDANEDEDLELDSVIVVTASKREATLQETPIAVSVVGAEKIEDAQIRDLLDIQNLVPSLRVDQLQDSAGTNFIIRGFGNGANNAGIEPSVGVFVDGVFRSRSAAAISDLPNLQRVEVLRGPQSTLFGKNASAGIISIVTEAPQFELGGSFELSYGNFDAVVARGYLTGPITDNVAASIAVNLNQRDGFAEDLFLGFDNNERNRWGVRGQLLIEPSDTASIRIIGDFDRIDEVCCAVTNIVDGPTGDIVRALGGTIVSNDRFSRTSAANFAPVNEIDNFGVSVQGDFETGDITFSAIAVYRGVRSFSDSDSDFTNLDSIASSANNDDIDTYTLEFRAVSDFDGPLNFLAGAFLFQEDIITTADFFYGPDFVRFANVLTGGQFSALEPTLRALIPDIPPGTFGAPGQGRTNDFDYSNTAFSLFGQIDLEITDRLTATVGANFTNDRKRVVQNNLSTDVFSGIDLVQAGVAAGVPATVANNPDFNPFLGLSALQFNPPFLNFPNAVEDGRTEDNDLSYTLRLLYEASDNISTYFTYATGFKASSFNLSNDGRPFPADFIPGSDFQSPPPPPSPIRDAGLAVNNLTTGTRFAGPEEAILFEIGIKGQWDLGAINIAIFDQTLNGFQGQVFTGTGFVLGNAEQQSVRGFEVDGTLTPVDGLTLNAAVTYLDAVFDSFTGGSAFDPDTLTVVPTDLSGVRPANIPEWSASVGARYAYDFENGSKMILAGDFFYESDTQIRDGLPQFTREVTEFNASVSYILTNGLQFTLWGRNLSNDVRNITVFPTTAQAGSLSGFRNLPRTYGVSARFKF